MIPIRIAGATNKLGEPENWDSTVHGKCNPLVIRRTDDGVFESAWEPTPVELAALNDGGSVVLSVVGGQPPVKLSVEPHPSLPAGRKRASLPVLWTGSMWPANAPPFPVEILQERDDRLVILTDDGQIWDVHKDIVSREVLR